MSELINIRYYSIQECGLYKGNEFQFGNIGDILQQLTAWYNDKAMNAPFSDRKTYERLDDLLPAYCFSIIHNQNRSLYLLTLWNETYQNEGAVFSINYDSHGLGENLPINETNLPEDSIPGFATYFLFSPQHNKVAIIKFNHTLLLGKTQLDFFLQNFIAKYSDYVVYQENEAQDYKVLGFRQNDNQVIQQLKPKFKTSVLRLPTVIESIINRCDDIRQMIVHKKIPNQAQNNQNFLTNWLRWFTNVEYQAQNHDLHVKTEVNITPTIDNLQETIDNWLEIQHEHNENLGFKFKGSANEVIWVNSMIAKQEVEIEVARLNNEIITPDSLLRNLAEIADFPT